MLATNPVDPYQAMRINFHGPAGRSVPYPRRDDPGLGQAGRALAAAALLVIGYVVGGSRR